MLYIILPYIYMLLKIAVFNLHPPDEVFMFHLLM